MTFAENSLTLTGVVIGLSPKDYYQSIFTQPVVDPYGPGIKTKKATEFKILHSIRLHHMAIRLLNYYLYKNNNNLGTSSHGYQVMIMSIYSTCGDRGVA